MMRKRKLQVEMMPEHGGGETFSREKLNLGFSVKSLLTVSWNEIFFSPGADKESLGTIGPRWVKS